MLLVKTKIKESTIHGIGLFADEFIKKETKIWEFTPNFDIKYTSDEIKMLPKRLREYILRYAWISKNTGKYCLASDDGKYINNSKQYNVESDYSEKQDEVTTHSLRDIHKGEELLYDYNFKIILI